ALHRACIAGGPDSMPWPTEARLENSRLTLRRSVDESGYLAIPWQIAEAGLLMATSATLMERPEPYDLAIELARGKVNQVRCQAWDWQAGGLNLPSEVLQQIQEASAAFSDAIALVPWPAASARAQTALG